MRRVGGAIARASGCGTAITLAGFAILGADFDWTSVDPVALVAFVFVGYCFAQAFAAILPPWERVWRFAAGFGCSIFAVATIQFLSDTSFDKERAIELVAILSGTAVGALMPRPSSVSPSDRSSMRLAYRVSLACVGASFSIVLLPWSFEQVIGPDQDIIDLVNVQVPSSAIDVETSCEDAFMDPSCWARFSVPRDDEPVLSPTTHPAPSAELQRRLRAMGNPDWRNVEITSGEVSRPPSLCANDYIVDRSVDGISTIYARNYGC